MSINFQQYPWITPPDYLGEPVRSTCNRSTKGDCVSGCLFFSSVFGRLFNNDVISLEIRVSGYYNGKHYTVNDPHLKLDGGTVKELSEAFKKAVSHRCDDRSYKMWLKTLVPHTEPRPSDEAFLGILQGFGEEYDCKYVKENYTNVYSPKFDRAFWFERWPTLEEAKSLAFLSDNVVFGVPSKNHYHGN